MNKVCGWSAVALSSVLSGGVLNASFQPDAIGTFSTATAEDRLFIKDGTELRCDLNFTSGYTDPWLVPKGSQVVQSVPPFVWQFAGLLPVNSYLKSVALHGYGSEQKERPWQDVQVAFYDGLRAEGAREFEAKIAYAGAYAYAPRWTDVEFIDVTVPARDKGTRLYKVKYNEPALKKLSVDDYRALVRELVDNPERISLEDIRGIVNDADGGGGVGVRLTADEVLESSENVIDIEATEFMKPEAIDDKEAGNWTLMPDGSSLLRSVESMVEK